MGGGVRKYCKLVVDCRETISVGLEREAKFATGLRCAVSISRITGFGIRSNPVQRGASDFGRSPLHLPPRYSLRGATTYTTFICFECTTVSARTLFSAMSFFRSNQPTPPPAPASYSRLPPADPMRGGPQRVPAPRYEDPSGYEKRPYDRRPPPPRGGGGGGGGSAAPVGSSTTST